MDIAIKLNNEYISDQLTFQLSEGIDGDGKEITNQVTGSSSYANFGYKGRWSPIDLRDTGVFYRSIIPKVFKDMFEMTSKDNKVEKLMETYGDAILNLTDDSVENIAQQVFPDFSENVQKQLLS